MNLPVILALALVVILQVGMMYELMRLRTSFEDSDK